MVAAVVCALSDARMATLFVAATDRIPPDKLHGYVIDCAPGQLARLGALEMLPACGAVASTEDPDRILRVLVRVSDELERRAENGHTSNDAHTVLVVNDVGAALDGGQGPAATPTSPWT